VTRRPQGAGGLRERNGRWQSSARDPRAGKTIYRTWPAGTTKREAERNHREWYADISKRRPADRTLTVAAYLASWLDVRAGDMSGATHTRHTANAKIIGRELGGVRLAELEPLTLQGLFAKRLEQYSPRSVRSIASTASLAFGDAVRWGRLPTNPMAAVRLPRPPVQADRVTPTTEQVHAICSSEPDPLWRTAWEVLAGTGARPGEVLALHWRDIEFNFGGRKLESGRQIPTSGRITIARTVTRARSSGETVGDRTKTGRTRTITIDAHLAGVLAAWRAELGSFELARVRADAPLFPAQRNPERPAPYHVLAERFRAAVRRVGADEAVTPHAVRHWFVSTWMAQGLPAQTIAEHCGHSIAEVLRRYGKHAPASALAEVATKMPRAATVLHGDRH